MVCVESKVIQLNYSLLIALILPSLVIEIRAQPNSGVNQNRKRTVSDPVSNFFTELGGLFLDADKALADQTAPKVQFEDSLATSIFRPSNEYFGRVQQNYRNFQKGLGKLIGNTLGPKTAYGDLELSTVSPPIANAVEKKGPSARALDKAEFNPFTSSDGARDRKSNSVEGNSVSQNEECSDVKFEDPFLEYLRKERCSRGNRNEAEEQIRKSIEKLLLDTRRASEILIPLGANTIDRFSNNLVRRQGDMEPDDSKQGRIIGDVLYSESVFDNQLRQFLNRHGQWFLDNPLLNRWRQGREITTERLEDVPTEATETLTSTEETLDATTVTEAEKTESYEPSSSTEQPKILSKSGKLLQDDLLPIESNYYNIVNDGDGIVEEEVDIVFEPQSVGDQEIEVQEIEDEPEDTIILAFTPNGVPLKLRMSPEIENPIRYLHKVLKSAGVSLNVPVESYEDLEPVGKEVLKLGSGILTRAVYIDVSNKNELKSLLKTLKSRVSGKS